MININNKKWEDLVFKDIQELLLGSDDETFFFEFKNDMIENEKIIREISAFANTYGGYILIGVENNKDVSGCDIWNEEKIQNMIHDAITPIPSFDIKKFISNNKKPIFVIRIDEGMQPPYITSKGKIYERVSSGSHVIKDSIKLTQLYYKREDQIKKIENKLEVDEIKNNQLLPSNLCAYLDIGFSLDTRDQFKIQKNIFNTNFEEIANELRKSKNEITISRVGYSMIITYGELKIENNENILSSMHNFIEIMSDGSVKMRMIFYTNKENNTSNIAHLFHIIDAFKYVYTSILGRNFNTNFVAAYRYEKLTVLKQFIAKVGLPCDDDYFQLFEEYCSEQTKKYGKNLIVTSNRIPKNGLHCIDKKYFSDNKIKYNSEEIIDELFAPHHYILGFIDKFPKLKNDTNYILK